MTVRTRTTRQVLSRRTVGAVVAFVASLVLVEASEHFPAHISPRGRLLAAAVWMAAAVWVYSTPCIACGMPLRWQAFRWAFSNRYAQRSPKCPACGTSIDHPQPIARR